MKRVMIALLVLFTILVGGCVQQKAIGETTQPAIVPVSLPAEVPAEKPQAPVEIPIEKPVNATKGVAAQVESLGNDLYKFNVNDKLVFDDKEIVLTDLDTSTSQFRATVNGEEIIFVNTKETEISQGVEMFVVSFKNFGLEDLRTYVELSIKKFVPGENEYLVYQNKPVKLSSGEQLAVSTTRISSTGVKTAPVTLGDVSEDIVEGKDAYFGNYTVTNVKTFVKDKSYALLKVVRN